MRGGDEEEGEGGRLQPAEVGGGGGEQTAQPAHMAGEEEAEKEGDE